MQPATEHATPELVFSSAVEGLFLCGLKGRVGPGLERRLLGLGINLAQPLAPAYPRSAWNQAVGAAAEELGAGLSEEEAFREVGRSVAVGFSQTILGRALVAFMKVVGPMRTLKRMSQNLRSGSNYGDCKMTPVGEREALFWINDSQLNPGYGAGLLSALLELTGARRASVVVDTKDSEGCTYRVSWE